MKIATVDVRIHTVILSELISRTHMKLATIIVAAMIVLRVVVMLVVIQPILNTVKPTHHVALIAIPATLVRHAAKLAVMNGVAPLELITATSAHTIFMDQLTTRNINKNYL
jgi:hypothetical protein